jgi:predicted nucleotidyltransferase
MLQLIQNIPLSENTSVDVFYHEQERYVAIRPVCDYLGIDDKNQRTAIETNPLLSPLSRILKVTAADGKLREMVCLPVDGILMWLCTINANNVKPEAFEEVITAQRFVHGVLRDYLNNRVIKQTKLISDRIKADIRIKELEDQLEANPLKTELDNLKAERKAIDKEIGLMNKEAYTQMQLALLP